MGDYRPKKTVWKYILVDVCTQRDFLESGAILQVANRDELIINLRHIFHWARANDIAIVSVIESHRPTEPLNGYPLHCIDNSPGQKKLDFTLTTPRFLVEADNYLSLPPDLRDNYRQLLFRKRSRDVLSNPKTDRFLTQLDTEQIYIVGVGIERAIKGLALGLHARHHRVTVVADACGHWSRADADLSARQLAAKGITLLKTTEVTSMPIKPERATPRYQRNRRHSSTGAPQSASGGRK